MTKSKKIILTVAAVVSALALAAGCVWFLWTPELPLPGMEKVSRVQYTINDEGKMAIMAPGQPIVTLDRTREHVDVSETSEAILYKTKDGQLYLYDLQGERALPQPPDGAHIHVFCILPGGQQYFCYGGFQEKTELFARIGSLKYPEQQKEVTVSTAGFKVFSPLFAYAITYHKDTGYCLWDWEEQQPITLPQGAQPIAVSDDGEYIYSCVKDEQTNRFALYVQQGVDGKAVQVVPEYKDVLFNGDATQVLIADYDNGYYLSCEGEPAEKLFEEECEQDFTFLMPSGRVLETGRWIYKCCYLETFEGVLLQSNQGYYRLGKTAKDTRIVMRTTRAVLAENGRSAYYVTDGNLYYAEDIFSDEEHLQIGQADWSDVSIEATSPDLKHIYYTVSVGQQKQSYYWNRELGNDAVALEKLYKKIVYSTTFQKMYYSDTEGNLYYGAAGETPQEITGLPALYNLVNVGGQLFATTRSEMGDGGKLYRSIDGERFEDTALHGMPQSDMVPGWC